MERKFIINLVTDDRFCKELIPLINKKYKVTILIEKAFRYKIESNAIKAAQLCNGEIKIV